MEKILVSACLLGEIVRYDGQVLTDCPPILKEWLDEDLVIPICPEVAGGLPVPRPPSEPQTGSGADVLGGRARVVDINGQDVTWAFLAGANEALRLVESNGVKIALLKADSPSCGSKRTYDGSFSGTLVVGQGVTAALLEKNGIQVFNETELDQIRSMIAD